MATYIFRNRHDKAICGSVAASSPTILFNHIDDKADPFSFEYCKSSSDALWLDEEHEWFIFKPMENFHVIPALIPAE
jgi:hypothetical protein